MTRRKHTRRSSASFAAFFASASAASDWRCFCRSLRFSSRSSTCLLNSSPSFPFFCLSSSKSGVDSAFSPYQPHAAVDAASRPNREGRSTAAPFGSAAPVACATPQRDPAGELRALPPPSSSPPQQQLPVKPRPTSHLLPSSLHQPTPDRHSAETTGRRTLAASAAPAASTVRTPAPSVSPGAFSLLPTRERPCTSTFT